MTVKQTLMYSIKISGALSSGRGFQCSVLNCWLIRTSIASTLNNEIK